MFEFLEFFAGGGMVRAGLGESWQCLLANDIDPAKGAAYSRNWGSETLRICDINDIDSSDVSGRADLAWGSFPCQDLSLAGAGAGLAGARSGTYWSFLRVLRGLRDEGRAPGIIALENVIGALTSHGGEDFRTICSSLRQLGYRVGAMTIDASLFLPKS